MNRADEQGIRHGKLPLTDYVNLAACTVLTVNQVFEIMAYQHNYKDWSKTLEKVVPGRKIRQPTATVVLGEATTKVVEEEQQQPTEQAQVVQQIPEEEKKEEDGKDE